MSYWLHEFERMDGEVFHQKGRECWMVNGKITVNPRKGKIFGIISEDSMEPQTMVEVAVWDKIKWMEFENRESKKFYKKHKKKGK
jgi:hypothetical protein